MSAARRGKTTSTDCVAEGAQRPIRRAALIGVIACLHALVLVGVGFARLEPPMALDTLNLDLIAQGVPMPEPQSPATADPPDPATAPETAATPEVVTTPAASALPPPPEAAEATEPRPKPPKPRLQKKPPAEPSRRKQASAASPARSEPRAGLPNGKAQDAGMTRAAYGALVLAQIRARKFYPPAAKEKGQQGTVEVAFRIGASGALASVALTASSGYSILDAAALQILRSVQVPPPPGGSFSGTTRLSFRFDR